MQDSVQLGATKRKEWLPFSSERHQIGHLDFWPHRRLAEGLLVWNRAGRESVRSVEKLSFRAASEVEEKCKIIQRFEFAKKVQGTILAQELHLTRKKRRKLRESNKRTKPAILSAILAFCFRDLRRSGAGPHQRRQLRSELHWKYKQVGKLG